MISSSLIKIPKGGKPEMPANPAKKVPKLFGNRRAILPILFTSLVPYPRTIFPAERNREDLIVLQVQGLRF